MIVNDSDLEIVDGVYVYRSLIVRNFQVLISIKLIKGVINFYSRNELCREKKINYLYYRKVSF